MIDLAAMRTKAELARAVRDTPFVRAIEKSLGPEGECLDGIYCPVMFEMWRLEDDIERHDTAQSSLSPEDREALIDAIDHWYHVNDFYHEVGREVLFGDEPPVPFAQQSDAELVESVEDTYEHELADDDYVDTAKLLVELEDESEADE